MAMHSASVYRYFVSYSHAHGFGHTQVSLAMPVRSESDVNVLTEAINRAAGFPVVILNFVLMSGPDTAPGIAAIVERLEAVIDSARHQLNDARADRGVIAERLLFALTALHRALTPNS